MSNHDHPIRVLARSQSSLSYPEKHQTRVQELLTISRGKFHTSFISRAIGTLYLENLTSVTQGSCMLHLMQLVGELDHSARTSL
jgi:hypothetical protein